jgi:hypothetical protein
MSAIMGLSSMGASATSCSRAHLLICSPAHRFTGSGTHAARRGVPLWAAVRVETTTNDQTSNLNHQRSNHRPATRNPQPATLNHQPSTLNHEPATINDQRATINDQRATINDQRATINDQRAKQSTACLATRGV